MNRQSIFALAAVPRQEWAWREVLAGEKNNLAVGKVLAQNNSCIDQPQSWRKHTLKHHGRSLSFQRSGTLRYS